MPHKTNYIGRGPMHPEQKAPLQRRPQSIRPPQGVHPMQGARPPQSVRPLVLFQPSGTRKKQRHRCCALFVSLFFCFSLIALIACLMIFVKPRLVLNGSDVIEVEVFGEFSDPGCKASFLFFDLSDKMESQKDPSTAKVGKFEKEYMLTYLGRTYTIYRTIQVVDKTPPKLQLHGDVELRFHP